MSDTETAVTLTDEAGANNQGAETATVRIATTDDYQAATSLFRILLGEPYTLNENLWEQVCKGDGHRAFVAEAHGEVVGLAILIVSDRIRLSAGTKRRRFHLDQLIVRPDERRKGHAHVLLEHIKQIAASEAPSYIIVNCDFTNVAARKTYEGAGLHLVRQAQDRFEIAFQ